MSMRSVECYLCSDVALENRAMSHARNANKYEEEYDENGTTGIPCAKYRTS